MPWARNACELRSRSPALLSRLSSCCCWLAFNCGKQRRHFRGRHRLDLPAVLIVEVADPQHAALAEKALRHTALIGARLLLSNGRDVELLDRLLASLLREKEVVEAAELLIERRLLVAIGEVKADLGAMKQSIVRANRIIDQPDARSAHRPKELVLLCPSPERVVEPVLVVSFNLRRVVVVGAIQGLIDPIG